MHLEGEWTTEQGWAHWDHHLRRGGQEQLKLGQLWPEHPSLSPTVLPLTAPKALVMKRVNKITQHTQHPQSCHSNGSVKCPEHHIPTLILSSPPSPINTQNPKTGSLLPGGWQGKIHKYWCRKKKSTFLGEGGSAYHAPGASAPSAFCGAKPSFKGWVLCQLTSPVKASHFPFQPINTTRSQEPSLASDHFWKGLVLPPEAAFPDEAGTEDALHMPAKHKLHL